MPKSKKEIKKEKRSNQAINNGSVTCNMEIRFAAGGQTSGHGFSRVGSCAEPDGWQQAMSATKGGPRKRINGIFSQQNEWPCQTCKAFFEQKSRDHNCEVLIRITPRPGCNQTYFDHWVDADVIPDTHNVRNGLTLRYLNNEWQAGNT